MIYWVPNIFGITKNNKTKIVSLLLLNAGHMGEVKLLKWFFLKWKQKSNLLWNICKKNCKYSYVKKEAFYLIVNVLIPRVVHLYCSTSLFIFLFLLHFIAWFHKRRGGSKSLMIHFFICKFKKQKEGGGAHLLLSKQNRQLIINNIYYTY